MANVNVRNLPNEVHRAMKPEGHVKLGSYLAALARKSGGLTDEEHALFDRSRIKSPARTASFVQETVR